MGVSGQVFTALAAENGPPDRLMIDATHLKAHRLLKGPVEQQTARCLRW